MEQRAICHHGFPVCVPAVIEHNDQRRTNCILAGNFRNPSCSELETQDESSQALILTLAFLRYLFLLSQTAAKLDHILSRKKKSVRYV
jgi:hypothetical protein